MQDLFSILPNSHFESIEKILDSTSNLDQKLDNNQNTLLHIACQYHLETKTIKKLIESGINIYTINKYRWTPLYVNFLYSNSTGKKTKEELTNCRIEITKEFIRNGFDINSDNFLHLLCSENSDPLILKFLLDQKANPNKLDENEKTPLIIAIQNNLVEHVELLVSYGADVNYVDEQSNTALFYACKLKCEVRIIEILLEKPNEKINYNLIGNSKAILHVCNTWWKERFVVLEKLIKSGCRF
ncbi:ankyrin repeat family protein [Anaeramoeba ignava]|uniref:Ankyrin repeat family protein n=1 Tax=Anaeramoeba ignava TaxID=1746090 RepID=A0A9Q0LGK4_ANAIG|nr:ankyrin repeat family protein [Anaeramoeba ignava]